MKPGILAAVILGGFAVGAGLSTLWQGEAPAMGPDEAAFRSFKRACLPGARGETPPTGDGLDLQHLEGRTWLDPETGAVVTLKNTACHVSVMSETAGAAPFDPLARRMAAVVATDLPHLAHAPVNAANWSAAESWTEGRRDTGEKWGVWLIQRDAGTSDPGLSVLVRYPPSEFR